MPPAATSVVVRPMKTRRRPSTPIAGRLAKEATMIPTIIGARPSAASDGLRPSPSCRKREAT